MWKLLFLVIQILVASVNSRATESMESAEDHSPSVETSERNQPRRPTNGFSILRQVDEPIFSFINKLVNTTYLTSRSALKRIKSQSEKRQEFENQIEDFVEHLPSFPILILDDISHL